MQNSRALKQLGAALVAGVCLFLDGCAVPAARTEMAMVPDQQVAAADVVLEAVLPPTTLVAAAPAPAPAPAAPAAASRRSSTRPPRSSGSSRRA